MLHNKLTDWEYFRDLVSSSLSAEIRLKSEEDIESAVEFFTTSVQNAAWNSIPFQRNNKPDLP